MRVYKTEYKYRDGKKHKAVKWYIDIFDHNQLIPIMNKVCALSFRPEGHKVARSGEIY
jgi:hypothetical protein